MKVILISALLLVCLLVAAPCLAYTTTKPTVFATKTTGPAAVADTGSVNIRTEPSGAQVYVDGELKGSTPVAITGLSAGSHTILLTHYGYQDQITFVTIIPGQMEQYSTRLAPGTDEVEMRFQVPGFESLLAFAGIGVVFMARRLLC
jgi:hypothetical protein